MASEYAHGWVLMLQSVARWSTGQKQTQKTHKTENIQLARLWRLLLTGKEHET